MTLILKESTRFRRDVNLMKRRSKDITKLQRVILSLVQQEPLSPRLKDHPLIGNWSGYRECHIEPDWLLIYEITKHDVQLVRTGTHSDLFKK
jgi:mRNA interferase YafQ